MRDNRCRSIDQLFLVETPLAAPEPYRRWANSFMSLHSRPDGDRSLPQHLAEAIGRAWGKITGKQIGRASCRERGCKYVEISGVAVSLKKKKYRETKHNQHKNNRH